MESAGEQPGNAGVGPSLVEEQPEAKKKKEKLNKDGESFTGTQFCFLFTC